MYSWRTFMSLFCTLLCRSFSISSNPVFQSSGLFPVLSKKVVAYTYNVKCSVIVSLQWSQSFRAFTQAFEPLELMFMNEWEVWISFHFSTCWVQIFPAPILERIFFKKSILTSKSNPGSYSCERLLVDSLFYFVCLHSGLPQNPYSFLLLWLCHNSSRSGTAMPLAFLSS